MKKFEYFERDFFIIFEELLKGTMTPSTSIRIAEQAFKQAKKNTIIVAKVTNNLMEEK